MTLIGDKQLWMPGFLRDPPWTLDMVSNPAVLKDSGLWHSGRLRVPDPTPRTQAQGPRVCLGDTLAARVPADAGAVVHRPQAEKTAAWLCRAQRQRPHHTGAVGTLTPDPLSPAYMMVTIYFTASKHLELDIVHSKGVPGFSRDAAPPANSGPRLQTAIPPSSLLAHLCKVCGCAVLEVQLQPLQ